MPKLAFPPCEGVNASLWTRRITGCPAASIAAAFASWVLPTAAHADCGVTDSGIPENVVAAVDFAALRKTLAQSGVAFAQRTAARRASDFPKARLRFKRVTAHT
jgi:hypothetical protein